MRGSQVPGHHVKDADLSITDYLHVNGVEELSVTYICKYINKGSDQAVFALEKQHDEVSRYETGRYISSSEAAWRIFCFPIHECFPPVVHLAVHLENGQRIYFTADNVVEKDCVLAIRGQPLHKYNLPAPSHKHEHTAANPDYFRELAYNICDLSKAVDDNEPRLNTEQRNIYHEVMTRVHCQSGRIFFLDAPGGTSKTFLINMLLARVRRDSNIAIAVVSSGIAVTLLEGGQMAHSAFKLPLNLNNTETLLCNISKQSNMAQVLRQCKLIVWDECTMAHRVGIEALYRTLPDIRNNNSLMGGLTVLLAGDFRQSLPVVPRGTHADEVKASFKSSYLWPTVKVLSLRVNMRVHLTGDVKAGEF
ncbi:uncharacterized protein LOC115083287 [Rhinatrema bivittatum]|uniref:uncharacterized protein LOC115083287 n=1 Tax=Rhinatrema bivittatum TaxID=194408 RepID=UPI00112BB104|nr:uncharacterized protein LOC115083287 [Rhinatrema bivittatum]